MIKLEDYIFDLEKFFELKNELDKKFIQELYVKLTRDYNDFLAGCTNYNVFLFNFNTLLNHGFLVNKTLYNREKVLDFLDV